MNTYSFEKCLIKFRILELSQYLTHDGNFWRLDSWTYYEYWLETRQAELMNFKKENVVKQEVEEDGTFLEHIELEAKCLTLWYYLATNIWYYDGTYDIQKSTIDLL